MSTFGRSFAVALLLLLVSACIGEPFTVGTRDSDSGGPADAISSSDASDAATAFDGGTSDGGTRSDAGEVSCRVTPWTCSACSNGNCYKANDFGPERFCVVDKSNGIVTGVHAASVTPPCACEVGLTCQCVLAFSKPCPLGKTPRCTPDPDAILMIWCE